MLINKKTFEETVRHIILIGIAWITLIPLVWMVLTSFKTEKGVFTGPMFWPESFNLAGYARVFRELPIFLWTANSFIIAFFQIAGQLLVCILAAYAFAHFRFRYREILFFFVLMTMMIPQQVTMIPTYLIVHKLGWINSFMGVIVPHIVSGYAIFLLRQIFLTVPRELVDSSVIDGCSPIRTMWYVYVRLSIPVISALVVIQFVGIWNDYQWPLLILTDQLNQPLPVALIQFRKEGLLEYVPTMAVATLSMIPVLILFIAAQRNFIEGFVTSGLKG